MVLHLVHGEGPSMRHRTPTAPQPCTRSLGVGPVPTAWGHDRAKLPSDDDASSTSSENPQHEVWGGIEQLGSDSSSSQGARRRRSFAFMGRAKLRILSDSHASSSSAEESTAWEPRSLRVEDSTSSAAARPAEPRTTPQVEDRSAAAADGQSEAQAAPQTEDASAEKGIEPPPAPLTAEAARRLSRGSVKHLTGNCHVCNYFNTKVGCTKGASCTFCHLHGAEPRRRPGKSKNAKAKSEAGAPDQPSQTGQGVEQRVTARGGGRPLGGSRRPQGPRGQRIRERRVQTSASSSLRWQ
mmetsp:Transcript_47948/g.133232  ORF Transcript_47948/g.133232 Transcript_47948/m.133232 type:complete len:296 (-) Transcript_47948:285-1172(-)